MALTRYFLCKNFSCRENNWFKEWEATTKKSKCPVCERKGERLLRQMRCGNAECKKHGRCKRHKGEGKEACKDCKDCELLEWKWIVSATPSQCHGCMQDGVLVERGKEKGVYSLCFLCDNIERMCENKFTVLCEMTDTAPCHNCKRSTVRPYGLLNRNWINRTNSGKTHKCSKCIGRNRSCPNLERAKLERDLRRKRKTS